jgi:hypothetical protein
MYFKILNIDKSKDNGFKKSIKYIKIKLYQASNNKLLSNR